MRRDLGIFTKKCSSCKEERLKTALYNPNDETSKLILVCQNCGYQESLTRNPKKDWCWACKGYDRERDVHYDDCLCSCHTQVYPYQERLP